MRRIIKLGGSLLHWSHLGDRFASWLDSQVPACNVIIPGGGAGVDRLRKLQSVYGWDDHQAHWMAVDYLSITARQACQALKRLAPHLERLHRLDEVFETDGHPLKVIDCTWFLRHAEAAAPGMSLECGWHVTSDSVAARVAYLAAADELVLLKSTAPRAKTWQGAADEGYVDPYFPRLVTSLPRARWVNLRQRLNRTSPVD